MAFAISPASALNPWLQILAALEKKVIRQSFETWLKPTGKPRTSGGPRGARPGHPGNGRRLLRPTEVRLIEPAPCPCGHGALVSLAPYYTHQVIELPPIAMDIRDTRNCTK